MASKNPLLQALKSIRKSIPFAPDPKPVVTVLELAGVIGAAGGSARGLSLARLESAIEAAFRPGDLKAVALAVNSPGGSPVQSALILRAIRRMAAKKETPVLSFIEDVGASGGYMLALAGDEIYADASSVVGSIGVISAGFGFQDAISRLGVERRVHTAGESKSLLDPFREENDDDVARLDAILQDMHAHFIGIVKERRGDALSDDHDDLFTGAFWTAGPAEARGLIDGIAHLDDFLRKRFGEDVKLRRISPRGSPLKRLLGADSRVAAAGGVAGEALAAAEERALWERYGR